MTLYRKLRGSVISPVLLLSVDVELINDLPLSADFG